MSALLPCPFCGGEAESVRWSDHSADLHVGVCCGDCGAGIAAECDWHDTDEDVAAKLAEQERLWNTRPAELLTLRAADRPRLGHQGMVAAVSAPVEIPEGYAKTPWRRDPLLPRTILDADGRTLFTAHKSGRVGDIGTALATADLLFLAPDMAAELLSLRADVQRLTDALAAAEGEKPEAMLATWDRFICGDRDADKAAANRLILAACFAATAYEDAISGGITADGAPSALLRAFLIALIDAASPELDHLRMCNRPDAEAALSDPAS